jgi:chemotaxis protein MotB
MEDGDKPDPNAWLLTYGDLITLLMTFFVLMLAFSTINIDKLAEVLNFDKGVGDNIVSADLEETGLLDDKVVNRERLRIEKDELPSPLNDLDSISEEVVVFITENKLAKVIDLKRTEEGFMITIRADILFESGEAELKEEYLYFLDELTELLSRVTNDVKITGHTDDRYSEDDYTDSKLSIARATGVCRYFVEEGMLESTRFGVSGYGRYRPRLPNISGYNRAKNRRVEIIIEEIPRDE